MSKGITERELAAIMTAFLTPRSYSQKKILAKVFVMRWAIASGIQLRDIDNPEDIQWCVSTKDLS